ncbi:MAG: sensor domain-containing diguanylate cyclase [Spirochaetes bacterium]|nr:sensor domain-containing diguanylate cyclase [Spirochaetota bacterium]
MDKSLKQLYGNIGKLITSSLKLEQILQGIMEEVHLFFNPEFWSLLRLDNMTDELYFVIFNGPVKLTDVNDIRLNPGEGIAGAAAMNQKAYFVPDTSKETSFSFKVDARTGFTTKSIIAVPMICKGKVYGVIEIVNPVDEDYFSEDQFFILQTIADFSAIAFANAALYENTLKASYTDSLTGVSNRTKFNSLIGRWESSGCNDRRNSEKDFLSVIVLDLNDFKAINDTYGHFTGDDVLRAAALFFSTCIRNEDLLFRTGGDEFIILLREISADKLTKAQNRVLGQLKAGNGKKLTEDIAVNYSIGHASGKCHEIRQLIETADHQMYSSKRKIIKV